jgi:5-formyltetrahydrofolate cyclo-ligase
MIEKNSLRQQMKLKRSQLTAGSKDEMDRSIFDKLKQDETFLRANKIFIFVSLGQEVDTHKIILHALNLGKQVLVPKVISMAEGMKAIKINSLEELSPGKMGILEPTMEMKEVANVQDIELVILPGLAFDKQGGRIGYGGGFYDRFIKNVNKEAKIIGICYDFQIVSKVPMEEHDVKPSKLITETINISIN